MSFYPSAPSRSFVITLLSSGDGIDVVVGPIRSAAICSQRVCPKGVKSPSPPTAARLTYELWAWPPAGGQAHNS